MRRCRADRCAEAGVPDDVAFATKPDLALRMILRAPDAGVPAAWVTADEVYGQVSRLRRALEDRGIGSVLAVPVSQRVFTAIDGRVELRADQAAAGIPAQGVQADRRRGKGGTPPRSMT